MGITLGAGPHGVDLSGYDSVKLWVDYRGPEPRQQVRFYVMNHNPAFSKPEVLESAKVQEIFYDPSLYKPLEIKLSQFTVASWWSNEHPIPIEYAGLEFDNVIAVEIATGGNVIPGEHRIVVERVEFHGKLISAATFRLIIITVWLLAVFGYLLTYALVTRRQLAASDRSHLTLQRVNEALRLQTNVYRRLSRRDPLTGVLNRQGLGDDLVRAAKRGDDRLFPLSLVFMDIDHFKRINDEHGHNVGDQVLREFARLVKSHIQRDDLFARWGGEEFLLICPLTQPQDAQAIAERLRQLFAAHGWPLGLRVTSSFGVAPARAGEDLIESIKRADEAMYRAKKNGRNRVEIHAAQEQAEDAVA
jgi:diguanylate cyclase (GGDEF)-like protein